MLESPVRRAVLHALLLLLAMATLPAARADSTGQRERHDARAAVFGGVWCGTGPLREFTLRLQQRQQEVQGTLVRHERRRDLEGHVEGATLYTQSTRHGSLMLERTGDELRITGGDGLLALARGATFQRASGGACTG